MAKTIPDITAMLIDFHELSLRDDNAVIGRFQFYMRNSRKRLFSKSVRFDACKVEREPQRLTIRLLDTVSGAVPKTTAFYRFVPTPDFSQRYTQT